MLHRPSDEHSPIDSVNEKNVEEGRKAELSEKMIQLLNAIESTVTSLDLERRAPSSLSSDFSARNNSLSSSCCASLQAFLEKRLKDFERLVRNKQYYEEQVLLRSTEAEQLEYVVERLENRAKEISADISKVASEKRKNFKESDELKRSHMLAVAELRRKRERTENKVKRVKLEQDHLTKVAKRNHRYGA